MIVDFDYILKRIDFLINENQNSKVYTSSVGVKLKIQVWIKAILKPFYHRIIRPYYIGIKQVKREEEESQISFLHPIALNFMEYFFIKNQRPYFDTSIYFEKNQDDDIIEFFDNRIISVIAGLRGKVKTAIQKEDIKNKKCLYNKVKKGKDGFYYLKINGENEYILPVKYFAVDVFIHHYGLKKLSEEQKKYIENKDFLDIGAFCGDTCLAFLNYNPHRIYAYEPVKNTYDLLLKTTQRDNNNKIIPINKGVGEKVDSATIYADVLSPDCSSLVYGQGTRNSAHNVVEEQIEIATIDEECKDKKVGLIKMDIEGFEYYAIKGGLSTIQRDKPILLISIYHTAKDFFEIPPMIKAICPDYKFKYIDINPSDPIADKIFMAYI